MKKTIATIVGSGLLILGAYNLIPDKQPSLLELKQGEIKTVIDDGFECNLPTGYIKFIPIKEGLIKKKISFIDKKIIDKKIKVIDEFNNEYEVKEEGGTWKKISIIKQKPESNLTLKFKIETNFKLPVGEIKKPVKLADETWLMPSIAWDSSIKVKPKIDDVVRKNLNIVNISSFIIKEGNDYYLVKKVNKKWLDNAEYPIYTDATITYGSEYVFNSGSTGDYYGIDVVNLDSTHFVVAYIDNSNNKYGTAIIGTVSGTSITYGSEYVFNSATTSDISVDKLDTTHFVIAYVDVGNSSYGTAIIGTVSGTSITYGSEYVFNNYTTDEISITSLDSTNFVISFRDGGNSYYGTSIIGVASGNTITYGSKYVFAGNIFDIKNDNLGLNYFVISYKYNALIGKASGTVITYGETYSYTSGSCYYSSVSSLSQSSFVIVYGHDYATGTAIIGNITGTSTINYGEKYNFNAGDVMYMDVDNLDSSHFVVAYTDNGNSYYGTNIIGNISGTSTISFDTEYIFNSGITVYSAISSLNINNFVVAYSDYGNSLYGTNIIGNVSGISIIEEKPKPYIIIFD